MYSEAVLEHFRNPRNVGEVEDPDGVGEVGNPACGDVMRITIRVRDGRIAEARFRTFGCAVAIATSSVVTEMVTGLTLPEAAALSNQDVAAALGGLPPAKSRCSNLAADAVRAAVEDCLVRQGRGDEVREVLGGGPRR